MVGYQPIQSGKKKFHGNLGTPGVSPAVHFLTVQSDLLNQLWLPVQLSSSIKVGQWGRRGCQGLPWKRKRFRGWKTFSEGNYEGSLN